METKFMSTDKLFVRADGLKLNIGINQYPYRVMHSNYEGFYLFDYNQVFHGQNEKYYLYEIEIPKDAEIIWHKYKKLWRTDKIIIKNVYKIKEDFVKWFNKDKFNYDSISSFILCKYYKEYFNHWFNPQKYDWDKSSWALAAYCPEHFKVWYNPAKYNNKDVKYLEFCRKYGYSE